jgi:hypothetical protein
MSSRLLTAIRPVEADAGLLRFFLSVVLQISTMEMLLCLKFEGRCVFWLIKVLSTTAMEK